MTTHLLDPQKRHGVACNNRDARYYLNDRQFCSPEWSEVSCMTCKGTLIYGKLKRADRKS